MPRLITVSVALALLGASMLGAPILAQTDEPSIPPTPLPMWEEPSHQPVFHRGHLRVMDVFFPGGATSEYHLHENAATYVFVQDGRVADQSYGKPWIKVAEDALKRGTILMRTNYLVDNLFHRVRNIDTRPTQIFAVVNLSDKAENPLEAPLEMQDGEIDNAWFRVRRMEIAPQSTSAELRLADDGILMQVHDGQSHVQINGVVSDYKSIGGGFSYHPAGTTLKVANDSDQAGDFVLIEVKD